MTLCYVQWKSVTYSGKVRGIKRGRLGQGGRDGDTHAGSAAYPTWCFFWERWGRGGTVKDGGGKLGAEKRNEGGTQGNAGTKPGKGGKKRITISWGPGGKGGKGKNGVYGWGKREGKNGRGGGGGRQQGRGREVGELLEGDNTVGMIRTITYS